MDAVVKIVEPKGFIEGKVDCEGLTPAGSGSPNMMRYWPENHRQLN